MARLYCANGPNSASLFWAGGPAQWNRARVLDQQRRHYGLRLAGSGVGKGRSSPVWGVGIGRSSPEG
jgi:hypothetical protein